MPSVNCGTLAFFHACLGARLCLIKRFSRLVRDLQPLVFAGNSRFLTLNLMYGRRISDRAYWGVGKVC